MRLKYMGTADVAILEKGDKVNNLLPDGLSVGLVFNRANGFIVETDDVGLPEEEVQAILDNDGDRFKNVTGLKRVPSSEHEKIFLGHGRQQAAPAAAVEDDSPAGDATPPDDDPAKTDPSDTTTTSTDTGGSPRGRSGRSGG